MKWLALPLLALTLAACSTAPKKSPPPRSGKVERPAHAPSSPVASARGCTGKYKPAEEDMSKRGDYTAGGLYAPGVADTTPDYVPDVDCIAEPVVTNEAPSRLGNRSPYSVLGKQYVVMQKVEGYVEQGTASYYGNKFHGRRTSNQEVYDMYAFTAAHKTLPLPSFARVTNLDNGKTVVVRVNDRGPFHDGRVIDLSYAAAVKLGITQRGTGRVEVRALTPGDGTMLASNAAVAPVKTTIATGVPTRIATGKPTAMDQLVDALPARAVASNAGAAQTGTPASSAPTSSAPAKQPEPSRYSQPWRYHASAQAGDKPSTESFDQWMASRGVHVATGKPAAVDDKSDESDKSTKSTPRTVAMSSRPPAPTPTPAATSNTSSTMRDRGDGVRLQVASFASRENADRALARLTAAGIPRASLSDTPSNGRTLWRLRVEAADAAAAAELTGRIAGLGFGPPQVVRE